MVCFTSYTPVAALYFSNASPDDAACTEMRHI